MKYYRGKSSQCYRETSANKAVVGVFFNKVAGLRPSRDSKRLQRRCFPVKFATLLGTPILKISVNDCFFYLHS